jgi:cell division protein ZapA (FtsZ GTPase activity inhibitor)
MIGAKVDIEVVGCKFKGLEMEGLSELEVLSVAGQVEERMKRISKDYNIVDSRRLALMAALEFAADLQRMQAAAQNVEAVSEAKLETMILALEKAVEHPGRPAKTHAPER